MLLLFNIIIILFLMQCSQAKEVTYQDVDISDRIADSDYSESSSSSPAGRGSSDSDDDILDKANAGNCFDIDWLDADDGEKTVVGEHEA